MDAIKAADLITNLVKKSNLNFCIQESPFSLCINLRKSFIKNKDGKNLEPSRDIFFNNSEVTMTQNVKLEQENSYLKESNGRLESELQKYYENIQDLSIKLEESEKEMGEALMWANNAAKENEKLKVLFETEALENGNKELQTEFVMLREEKHAGDIAFELKNKELAALKIQNEELETQVKNDDELREKLSELENENLKLKDVLYGCCECGMFTCECEDLVNEDDDCSHAQLQLQPSPPPSTSPEEPALLLPSPALDLSLGHHPLHHLV